jgi:hypothetical protein
MKRLALVAAVLTLAACTTKDTKTETTDSAAMMAPAPAATTTPADTSMKMDSTMKHDSTMKKDSTAKKP